jgi:hypothetical protein
MLSSTIYPAPPFPRCQRNHQNLYFRNSADTTSFRLVVQRLRQNSGGFWPLFLSGYALPFGSCD